MNEAPDEPPVVGDDQVDSNQAGNPFQPSELAATALPGGEVTLPPYDVAYWSMSIGFFLAMLLFSYPLPVFMPVAIGAFFAFLRVPILRSAIHKRASLNVQQGIATPIASPQRMFFISVAILAGATVASSIAFVAICLPTSLIGFSYNMGGSNQSGEAVALAFGLGIAGAIGCFLLIFLVSLRLNS